MSPCSPGSSGAARPGAYRRMVAIIAAGVALLLPTAGAPATARAAEPAKGLSAAASPGAGDAGAQILETSVLAAPRPVPASDDRTHLVYEVQLRNVSAGPVNLDRVEVQEPDGTGPVAVYDSRAIERVMLDPKARTFSRTLAPGKSASLLLDVTVAAGARVPARLVHRFDVSGAADRTLRGAATKVDRRAPLNLSPPLRGDGFAVYGCCRPPFVHRLAVMDLNGGTFAAQRYAIDFVQTTDGVHSYAGDQARNESYFIFGEGVRAVADGKVLAVRDGVAANTPQKLPANRAPENLTGNFVIQDLGGGAYALYAHMQKDSLRVRPGDRLTRGQELGLAGNSGNSTEAHLHFHVVDSPGVPLGVAGDSVPYTFDRFRIRNRITGLDSEPEAPVRADAPPAPDRTGRYPLTGDVVDFP
ncbi:peptidase M23-like protein [Actinoplanes xinjiangensis]|uniref:Peptidase M23-like protein n=1 Tax=Actinoplanes xinjiangensis TaxID=512350 RepID=A0A316FDL4_9ACTN|nr:peptidase M23-like protein [Actinoplanes xinjiangensis]